MQKQVKMVTCVLTMEKIFLTERGRSLLLESQRPQQTKRHKTSKGLIPTKVSPLSLVSHSSKFPLHRRRIIAIRYADSQCLPRRHSHRLVNPTILNASTPP